MLSLQHIRTTATYKMQRIWNCFRLGRICQGNKWLLFTLTTFCISIPVKEANTIHLWSGKMESQDPQLSKGEKDCSSGVCCIYWTHSEGMLKVFFFFLAPVSITTLRAPITVLHIKEFYAISLDAFGKCWGYLCRYLDFEISFSVIRLGGNWITYKLFLEYQPKMT